MSFVKCPAEPDHFAGVNITGIRKHIYNCRHLKQKDQETKVLQCQYCLVNFFLSQRDLEHHFKECGSFKKEIPWCSTANVIIILPDPSIKEQSITQIPKNWEFYRDLKQKKKRQKQRQVDYLGGEQEYGQNESYNIKEESNSIKKEDSQLQNTEEGQIQTQETQLKAEEAQLQTEESEPSAEKSLVKVKMEYGGEQSEKNSKNQSSVSQKRSSQWNDEPSILKKLKFNELELSESQRMEMQRRENEENMIEQHRERLRNKIKVDDYQNYVYY